MAKGDWVTTSDCMLADRVFEAPSYLHDIITERGEPGGGYPSAFDLWNYFKYNASAAELTWDSIEGVNVSNGDLDAYLAGTTSGTRKPIFEFELVDSLIAPPGGKATFAAMAWLDGSVYDVDFYTLTYDDQNVRTLYRRWGQIFRWNKNNSRVKFVCGFYNRNGYDFASFGLCVLDGTWQYDGRSMQITVTNLSNVTGGGTIKGTSGDPNIDKDKTKPTNKIPVGDRKRGGDGSRDLTTSIISLPSLPPKTATSTGFVTLYSVTESILRLLADKLFTDTWTQALDNFFQNADDVIAGLSIIPFTPALGGRAKPRVGLFTLDVAMTTIASQYKEIDCGEIFVDEYYGSCFDYSPYTKVSIFLPYIGIRSLDTDEVMGKTIGVKYYCDAYSGSCLACVYVKVNPNDITEPGSTPTVKYTFSGNCAQQVPTAAASWDRMVQSGIALACVALPAIAAGGAAIMSAGYGASAAMGAMEGSSVGAGFATRSVATHAYHGAAESWAASGSKAMSAALEGATMATAMSGKPTVERTGSLGSGVGFLGPQKPYLIRIIPRQSIPEEYMDFEGYPSNEYGTLGSLEGFAQVEDIHLTEVYATGPEKQEIMKILKEGVLL